MDPIMGGLIAGGANLLGSVFGTTQNNQMQLQMQQQQEAYNSQMSNTAYQRASADMKAAGLNPMMMFGSGSAASSPTAPSVNIQSPVKDVGSGIQNAVQSAVAMKTADATINNLVQQNANLKTQQDLDVARKQSVWADTDFTASKTAISDQAIHGAINEALHADNEAEFRQTKAGKLLDQAGMAGRSVSDVLSPVGSLVSSARNAARIGSPYGW